MHSMIGGVWYIKRINIYLHIPHHIVTHATLNNSDV